MPDRPKVLVCTDYNPDEVRCFYEVPTEIYRRVLAKGDARTFAQALADLLLERRDA